MLGQREHTLPLSKEESKGIRDAALRIAKGHLNKDDHKIVTHFNKLRATNKHRFIWM